MRIPLQSANGAFLPAARYHPSMRGLLVARDEETSCFLSTETIPVSLPSTGAGRCTSNRRNGRQSPRYYDGAATAASTPGVSSARGQIREDSYRAMIAGGMILPAVAPMCQRCHAVSSESSVNADTTPARDIGLSAKHNAVNVFSAGLRRPQAAIHDPPVW